MTLFLVFFLSVSVLFPQKAQAEMPVRVRAFLTIVGYGTAGGALLGTASMAFGNSTRAVAQGASLGLYAGLIFASYVLVSHHQKRTGNYDDNSSPYSESKDIYSEGDGGGTGEGNESKGGFFDRMETINTKFQPQNGKGGNLPPLYLNFLQYNF